MLAAVTVTAMPGWEKKKRKSSKRKKGVLLEARTGLPWHSGRSLQSRSRCAPAASHRPDRVAGAPAWRVVVAEDTLGEYLLWRVVCCRGSALRKGSGKLHAARGEGRVREASRSAVREGSGKLHAARRGKGPGAWLCREDSVVAGSDDGKPGLK